MSSSNKYVASLSFFSKLIQDWTRLEETNQHERDQMVQRWVRSVAELDFLTPASSDVGMLVDSSDDYVGAMRSVSQAGSCVEEESCVQEAATPEIMMDWEYRCDGFTVDEPEIYYDASEELSSDVPPTPSNSPSSQPIVSEWPTENWDYQSPDLQSPVHVLCYCGRWLWAKPESRELRLKFIECECGHSTLCYNKIPESAMQADSFNKQLDEWKNERSEELFLKFNTRLDATYTLHNCL